MNLYLSQNKKLKKHQKVHTVFSSAKFPILGPNVSTGSDLRQPEPSPHGPAHKKGSPQHDWHLLAALAGPAQHWHRTDCQEHIHGVSSSPASCEPKKEEAFCGLSTEPAGTSWRLFYSTFVLSQPSTTIVSLPGEVVGGQRG